MEKQINDLIEVIGLMNEKLNYSIWIQTNAETRMTIRTKLEEIQKEITRINPDKENVEIAND
jgi:hypothetical protein